MDISDSSKSDIDTSSRPMGKKPVGYSIDDHQANNIKGEYKEYWFAKAQKIDKKLENAVVR